MRRKQHVRPIAPILSGSRKGTTKNTGADTRSTRRRSGGATALGVDGDGKSSENEENLGEHGFENVFVKSGVIRVPAFLNAFIYTRTDEILCEHVFVRSA